MLFNSIEYIILLAITVPCYWLARSLKARLVILLVSSAVFYASWEPAFLLLLFGLIIVNFFIVQARERSLKNILLVVVLLNLIILGYYKYTNFFLGMFKDVYSFFDASISLDKYSLILPLGISFFVFQLISYVVDVARGRIRKETSLLRFAVFIAFFPQLIAGPICRGDQLLPQLRTLQPFRKENLFQGILMFGVGLFLKVGIADSLAEYVDIVYSNTQAATQYSAILATTAFGVQILCDFWGYSTMALGVALMFGISIPANFDLPYISRSLQEFWRRWHITLSFWLRDYLYFPLGGNRKGNAKTLRNLVLVMGLGGLWHGASYNFIIWGLLHGSWLTVERILTRRVAPSIFSSPNRIRQILFAPIGWATTMLVVFTAWVFFRAETLPQSTAILTSIFNGSHTWVSPVDAQITMKVLLIFIVTMIPLHWLNSAGLNTNFYKDTHDKHKKRDTHGLTGDGQPWSIAPVALSGSMRLSEGILILPCTAKVVISFWLISAALILGSGKTVPFIYFQF